MARNFDIKVLSPLLMVVQEPSMRELSINLNKDLNQLEANTEYTMADIKQALAKYNMTLAEGKQIDPETTHYGDVDIDFEIPIYYRENPNENPIEFGFLILKTKRG